MCNQGNSKMRAAGAGVSVVVGTSNAQIRRDTAKLHEIRSKYLADLVFLHSEFSKVKAEVMPSQPQDSAADVSVTRLVHFLDLLEQMIHRLQKPNRDQAFFASLETLETTITRIVLPIKGRLIAQLQAENCEHSSATYHQQTLGMLSEEAPTFDTWRMASGNVAIKTEGLQFGCEGSGVEQPSNTDRCRTGHHCLADCISSDEGSTSNDSLASLQEELYLADTEMFREVSPFSTDLSSTDDDCDHQRHVKRSRNGANEVGTESGLKIPRKKARSDIVASTLSSGIKTECADIPFVSVDSVSCTRTSDLKPFEELSDDNVAEMQRRKPRDEPKRRRPVNSVVPNPRKVRDAEYTCSKCTETYTQVVPENPWWALYAHTCPKCHQIQVPRIDITAETNSIEADPNFMALYGHEDCGEDVDDEDLDEEFEEDEDDDASDSVDMDSAFPFGKNGLLAPEEASRLLVLMSHARTCSGQHNSPEHEEVCRATKFLMLHLRDCPGVTVEGTECPLQWCAPCKKMLAHLTRCYEPATCSVCNPFNLPDSLRSLHHLNKHQHHNLHSTSQHDLDFGEPVQAQTQVPMPTEDIDEHVDENLLDPFVSTLASAPGYAYSYFEEEALDDSSAVTLSFPPPQQSQFMLQHTVHV